MAYNIPTLQEIIDRIEADFQSRIDSTTSFLRRSVFKVFSRVYGGVTKTVYGFLEDQEKQIFITSADASRLEIAGNEYGVPVRNAQRANGTGNGTGTSGSLISAGKEVKSATGAFYTTDEAAIIENGIFTVNITAKEVGDASNDDPGTSLTFVTPIPGVSTQIIIDSDGISGGFNKEDPDSHRDRVLTRKRTPPSAGTSFDYVNWALEVPGNEQAWAFENYFGPGTIGLAFILENKVLPNAEQRQETFDYINSHLDPITGKTIGRPVTAGLIIIELFYEAINFTIQINPNNSVVRNNVFTLLESTIAQIGGPGVTIPLSKLSEAISSAANEEAHRIITPEDDIATPTNKYPILGEITFQDYMQ